MNVEVTFKTPDVGYKWRTRTVLFELVSTLTRPEWEKIIRGRYHSRAVIISIREIPQAKPVFTL